MAGVLDGVRVIDFGQYIAGPMAAMFLGDHGADVIRVDPPGRLVRRDGSVGRRHPGVRGGEHQQKAHPADIDSEIAGLLLAEAHDVRLPAQHITRL